MPYIHTEDLTQGRIYPEHDEIYNGLDCCITGEVLDVLLRQNNELPTAYDYEIGLQGPILEMMLRGFKVNQIQRRKALDYLATRKAILYSHLDAFAYAVWGMPLNPRSPLQLKKFFYGALGLPEVWIFDKGVRKLSFKREVLEKLEFHFYAMPIIACILGIRDISKQMEILETEIDPDGRMRTSYNIGGTENWRLSSSANAMGTGGNLQNWPPELRQVFVADEGMKLGVLDFEQAESREIGWKCGVVFDDWSYLNACESGDLHTRVTKMVWPTALPWTGQDAQDKEIASNTILYREYPYRHISKQLGHACLTEDHEVLTPDGWVSIATKPAYIMQWSENSSEFVAVSYWTDKVVDGKLIQFDGNSVSLLMTPDHRVPYRSDTCSSVRERAAEQGPGRFMPLGDNWIGGPIEVPGRLIAAFMSDGHQHTKNFMKFHFHKQRKKDRLKYLCDELGYKWRENKDHIYVEGNLPKTAGSFMFAWTRQSLADFLDEYHHWDGHQAATSRSLSSINRTQLEWIQTFGRLLGIGGQIQKPRISGFGSQVYSLQQNNRKWAFGPFVHWWPVEKEPTRVLCPTVPSGWFYVRRQEKICVTGNTNYYGQPFGLARRLKILQALVEGFQKDYFAAFPAISRLHRWVAEQIQTVMELEYPFGVRRHFFGRPEDDTTLREAIASLGQVPTALRTNIGLYRIHKMKEVQVLAQTHDSVSFQYREADEHLVIPAAVACMTVWQEHKGRRYTVPVEAKVGWNWNNHHDVRKPTGPKNKPNPNGLLKYKGPGADTRQRLSMMEEPQ